MDKNTLSPDSHFSFRCAGCGDCCRNRRDLNLSGYDLYRLSKRLSLPADIVARAFGRIYIDTHLHIPALRLRPQEKSGNCPLLTSGGTCSVHSHKPLVCALYPLGQTIEIFPGIDPDSPDDRRKAVSYFVQDTDCAGEKLSLVLGEYLAGFGIMEREDIDIRWARDCLALSSRIKGLEERLRPVEMKYLQRKAVRALFLNYDPDGDFRTQYDKNIAELERTLSRLEGEK